MAKIPINIKEGRVEQPGEVIVGIDLGTTNSLVAYIKNGEPTVIRDSGGDSALVPSIIHFLPDDTPIVGSKAKDQLVLAPDRTIYSVKRLMGKSFQDLGEMQQHLGYTVIDEDADSLIKVRVGNRFYSPVELSAEVLKVLKRRIEEAVGQPVHKAVITVPAYFNDTQRQATRDAGKLAGLDVLRIVNEPTAASLAYGIGLDPDLEQKIVVYDLGGGTFDVSVLHIHQGIFEVLSTNGDTFLGGDDIDQLIVEYWKDHYLSAFAKSEHSSAINQQLRLLAEEAKRHLSSESVFEQSLNNIPFRLDLHTFNNLIGELIDRTIGHCRQALKDAKLTDDDIDQVILVGGSTRIPLLKNKVAEFFGKTCERPPPPRRSSGSGSSHSGRCIGWQPTRSIIIGRHATIAWH